MDEILVRSKKHNKALDELVRDDRRDEVKSPKPIKIIYKKKKSKIHKVSKKRNALFDAPMAPIPAKKRRDKASAPNVNNIVRQTGAVGVTQAQLDKLNKVDMSKFVYLDGKLVPKTANNSIDAVNFSNANRVSVDLSKPVQPNMKGHIDTPWEVYWRDINRPMTLQAIFNALPAQVRNAMLQYKQIDNFRPLSESLLKTVWEGVNSKNLNIIEMSPFGEEVVPLEHRRRFGYRVTPICQHQITGHA
jgi:hypothetical protein